MKTFWHTSEDLKTLIPVYRKRYSQFMIFSVFFILFGLVGRYYFSNEDFIFIALGVLGLITLAQNIYEYNWGWHKWEKTAKMVQTITPVEENITIECYVSGGHHYRVYRNNVRYYYYWELSLENFSNIKNKIKYSLTVPFDFSNFMLQNYQRDRTEYNNKTFSFKYKKAQIYFDPATPKIIVIRLPEIGLLIGEINYFQKIKYK